MERKEISKFVREMTQIVFVFIAPIVIVIILGKIVFSPADEYLVKYTCNNDYAQVIDMLLMKESSWDRLDMAAYKASPSVKSNPHVCLPC